MTMTMLMMLIHLTTHVGNQNIGITSESNENYRIIDGILERKIRGWRR